MAFSADLPQLIAEDLQKAFALTGKKGLGTGSYTGPGKSACYFVVERTRLGGGQSLDTSEFPFQGGWSHRSLNRKVQTFTATVSICGKDYMVRRNALEAALDVPTDDDTPGYIELPAWGRMPVVVEDWSIEESNTTQRLSTFEVTLRRIGLSTTAQRWETVKDPTIAKAGVLAAGTVVKTQACAQIAKALPTSKLSVSMIKQAFTAVQKRLAEIVGRIQVAKSNIASVAADVQMIITLLDEGITSPKTLALAMFGACDAIVGAVINLGMDVEDLFSSDDQDEVVGADNNPKHVLGQVLATTSDLDLSMGSARDVWTLQAVTAAYKTALFYTAAAIIPSAETVRTTPAREFFSQLVALEDQIDRSDRDLFLACSNLRQAVNQALTAMDLAQEQTKAVAQAQPLLSLAQTLGVDPGTFEAINDFDDLHVIRGDVTYV